MAEGDVAGAEVGGWLALDGAAVWVKFCECGGGRGSCDWVGTGLGGIVLWVGM